jgi:hypothetical protein
VVDDCLANHQEWDERSEERICIGHEESCHSRYVTHALHCMACNGIDRHQLFGCFSLVGTQFW